MVRTDPIKFAPCEHCGKEWAKCECRAFCANCGKPFASDYFDRFGIYAGKACNDRCAILARLPVDYVQDPFEPI